MRKTLLVLHIGACLLVGGAALAEDEATEAAKVHSRAGTKAYDLGRYLEAAKEYEAAYDAKPLAPILFNIAQAYRLGGEPEKALHFYETFLRRMPDVPTRPEVEDRIAELRKIIEQQKRTKAGPPQGTMDAEHSTTSLPPSVAPASTAGPMVVNSSTPIAPAQKPIYKRAWFWGVIGGAAVAVALGVGLGVGLSSSTTYPTSSTPLVGTVRW